MLSPMPILSSVVLAQGLLARIGDSAVRAELLPALLEGSRTATVALGALRNYGAVPEDLHAEMQHNDRWSITGFTTCVLDGTTADWVFVRAHTPDGPRLFVLETDDPCVTVTPQHSMDLTRSFARLDLEGAAARPLGATTDVDAALTNLSDLLVLQRQFVMSSFVVADAGSGLAEATPVRPVPQVSEGVANGTGDTIEQS